MKEGQQRVVVVETRLNTLCYEIGDESRSWDNFSHIDDSTP